MDVIALVGPSGTGKSHRALLVAHEYKADAIIDDGILIQDGKIIAGSSAKKEKSKMMAVRRAIFVLPGHAAEVKAALENSHPERLLILGTSENMVQRIAKTLQLPAIRQIIRIEDIATKAEMAKADFFRRKEGKHIIPVPTIELKPHFSGYLIDPIQSFFKRSSKPRRRLGEKSIVRPVFSFYGKLEIDDSAIRDIVLHLVKEHEYIKKVSGVKIKRLMDGDEELGLKVFMEVVLSYGKHIPTLISQTQESLKKSLEYMTGMVVHSVDINVKALYVG